MVTSWYIIACGIFLLLSAKTVLAGAFAGVPVLQYPRICPELTTFGGTPLPTRYYSNNCQVDVELNASRNGGHDINIVVMAPGYGSVGDILTQSEPFVAMALQDVENSHLLPGFRLNAYVAESRCSPFDATANTIRALSTGPPKHAILGAGCSEACVAVNDAMQYFNVLQVGHICVSVGLSDRERHPFFTRMAPNFKNSVLTVREVVMTFGWTRVGLIAGSRAINFLGREIFLELAQEDLDAGRYGWKILMVASIADEDGARTALIQARRYDGRILINAVYEDMAASIMCEAYKLGMWTPAWIQLSMSGWWATGFLDVQQPQTDCSMEQLYLAGFGWILVSPHGGFLSSDELHGLAKRPMSAIQAQYRAECKSFFGSRLGCNDVMSPYFYDGIWHLALLFHKYLIVEQRGYEDLNTEESRERLFNLSLEVDFLGLTGRVRQYNYVEPTTSDYKGSIGDREGPCSVRQLVGPPDDSLASIGYRLPGAVLLWIADVVWSATDDSKRVPCSSGQCDLSLAWLPRDAVPEECPQDKVFSPEAGCTECSAGSFANGTVCELCDRGSANNESGRSTCTACAPGTFSDFLGATSCTECVPGRFSKTQGQSHCDPCAQGSYAMGRGSSACALCAGEFVTALRGATSANECLCPAGTYRPFGDQRGDCLPCQEGVECRIGSDLSGDQVGGRHPPLILEGYYAEIDEGRFLSVFNCLDDGYRCRRGFPGENCADGRYGRVCSECESGKAPADDGSCHQCSAGSDILPVVMWAVSVLILLIAAYYFFDGSHVTKQSHYALLLTMTLSMVVVMGQQLGTEGIGNLGNLDWPAPMTALFRFFNILTLDAEALKVDCIVHTEPVLNFAMKELMFVLCVGLILIIHAANVSVWRKGLFRANTHILICSLGTLILVFYVAIFLSILAPWQCVRNPNGLWTVSPYPSVLCWHGAAAHQSMMLMAGLASLVPLGFLAHCCHVIAILPQKMRDGDAKFLRTYAYLFFRYKPICCWYSLFHLVRGLLVALTSITPVLGLQVLLLQVILILQLYLVAVQQPWRVHDANSLEAFLTLAVMLTLCCAAQITGGGSEDKDMARTFITVLCSAVVGAIATAAYVVLRMLAQTVLGKRKSFDFFICHHKVGAGCVARFINVEFAARGRKAFLDTDHLRDLDKLFDYVACHTQTLLLLCTEHVFTRPYCMGEVVTATHGQIKIAKVILPDFEEPDEEFIQNYEEIVSAELACLTQCGIHMPQIADTLRNVRRISGCTMPTGAWSAGTMRQLCTIVAKKEVCHIDYVLTHHAHADAEVVLIADLYDPEAACTSFILVDLLVMQMISGVSKVPTVLSDDVDVPVSATSFLLMCSTGALSKHAVLKHLLTMSKRDARGIPVVQSESFFFPDGQYFTSDPTRRVLAEQVCGDLAEVEDFCIFLVGIFKVIGTVFQPSSYSSTREVLELKAKELASRIGNCDGEETNSLVQPGRRSSSRKYSTLSIDVQLPGGYSSKRAIGTPHTTQSSGSSDVALSLAAVLMGAPSYSSHDPQRAERDENLHEGHLLSL